MSTSHSDGHLHLAPPGSPAGEPDLIQSGTAPLLRNRRPISAPKAALISLGLATVAALLVMLARPLLTKAPFRPAEIARHLDDTSNPRETQRALTQVAQEIGEGRPAVRRWYSAVLRLASNSDPALRQTAIWVMSHDPKSSDFHEAVSRLLSDPVPLVRWNAAVSLVKFGDPACRPQLREMLRSYTLESPAAGILRYERKENSYVESGSKIAAVADGGSITLISAPLTGFLDQRLAEGGAKVKIGEALAVLLPGGEQVSEALRSLAVVGQVDDLPDVERYGKSVSGMPDGIQKQARVTAEEIRKRSGTSPIPPPRD